MHTEHLQNVTFGRVVAGWLVAAAVTSFILLVLAAFDAVPLAGDSTWWSVLAAAVGFLAGGFFTGLRALQAPVLHGIGIGLTSLVAWLVANLVVFGLAGRESWAALTPTLTIVLLVTMMAAAVIGALLGYNFAVVGKPSLAEHEPIED
ncbi:MAG TPA: hypothetical protein VK939_04465 [Longimicrobiales bacterium]|nr:hypothetical protein [Longimicrobiales bacterium]